MLFYSHWSILLSKPPHSTSIKVNGFSWFLKKSASNIIMCAYAMHRVAKTINYNVCRMRWYRQNILPWEENDKDCMKTPTGEYSRAHSNLQKVEKGKKKKFKGLKVH